MYDEALRIIKNLGRIYIIINIRIERQYKS